MLVYFPACCMEEKQAEIKLLYRVPCKLLGGINSHTFSTQLLAMLHITG